MTWKERSRTYRSWFDMRRRCNNEAYWTYKYYGGRGIKVCQRWNTFANFLADMGLKPDGMQLDRIDNDKDYSPDNCRWATRREQQANTRKTRLITLEGRSLPLAAWARELGVTPNCINKRLIAKWSVKDALTIKSRRPV